MKFTYCLLVFLVCSLLLVVDANALHQSQTDDSKSRQESADPYFRPVVANASETGLTRSPEQNSDSGFAPLKAPGNKQPADRGRAETGDFRGPSLDISDRTANPKLKTVGHTEDSSTTANYSPAQQEQQTRQPTSRTQQTGESFEPTRVLARVGGHPIFVSDLSVEANQIIEQFIAGAPPEVKQAEIQKLYPRLLPKYIQSKLLLVDTLESLPPEAKVDNIYETAGSQFDEMMLPRLMEQAKVNSPAMLDAHYRAVGSSLRKVRQSWSESELVKYMMRSKININPDVSHREMFDLYEANKDEKYSVKAKVKWEQLMVRFDRYPTRQEAKNAISEMGNEVVHGAPLPAVAKRSSQGFNASEGGQQGWTTKGSLVNKDLDELLFTMEPNALSEAMETDRGYIIVRVLDRQDAGYIPFTEAQIEIRQQILNKKKDDEFQKYVDAVKKRIPVEVFDPTRVAENPQDNRR